MAPKYPALLAGLILLLWFGGTARAEETHDFLVLYSNDVHGETEPCG